MAARNSLPINQQKGPATPLAIFRDLFDAAAARNAMLSQDAVLTCVQQATITSGKIEIALDREAVAAWLSVLSVAINLCLWVQTLTR
tara:strand:- start:709 stop:969 length:261 start_codon:yes stop_codon:yes gene_type:complete